MEKTYSLAEYPGAVATTAQCAQVLVVTPVGLQGKGGIDRLNLYLHEYLARGGTADRLKFIGSRGERSGPFWAFTFLTALFRFAISCMSGRHDVAHIHVSTNGSALRKVWFSFIARVTGTPYVIQFHGMMSAEYELKRQRWFRALALLARHADRVIVLGESYRAPFERMGVSGGKIRVIHNGIPDIGVQTPIPRPATGCVHILFSGEVGERKGVHLLIEALALIGDIRTSWRCTIAGNGELSFYSDLVRTLGLDRRVEFTGWVDITRVHELMREADIVVLPSRAEALPLGLIEGASAGAALIASDVGAVRDVVLDGVNGIIIERNSEALAAALRSLINDDTTRERMQIASRQVYAERFHVERFANAVLRIHQEACGR